MSSKAQVRASNKYAAKTYRHITLNFKKRVADTVSVHIAARSESANSFFNRAAALQVAVDVGAVSVVGEVPPLGEYAEEGEVE